jgi:hypothetical protein
LSESEILTSQIDPSEAIPWLSYQDGSKGGNSSSAVDRFDSKDPVVALLVTLKDSLSNLAKYAA